MNKLKVIFLLLAVFISTVILAYFFENNYRVLVRYFFKFFQADKIKFVGKDFHLFASPYLLISFGIFSVLLSIILFRKNIKKRFHYLGLTIMMFFITTMATSFLDSFAKVAECTVCQDGVRSMHYNEVNYDLHFITSLVLALLPLLIIFLKKQNAEK